MKFRFSVYQQAWFGSLFNISVSSTSFRCCL